MTFNSLAISYGVEMILPLDETSGTVATDISGNGHDGTHVGDTLGQTSLQADASGHSIAVAADSGQRVTVASGSWMNVNAFTIGGLVRFGSAHDAGNGDPFISRYQVGDNYPFFMGRIYGASRFPGCQLVVNGFRRDVWGSSDLPDGTTAFMAARYDGAHIDFFVDTGSGLVKVATFATTGSVNWSTSDFEVFRYSAANVTTPEARGQSVFFETSALTDGQIAALSEAALYPFSVTMAGTSTLSVTGSQQVTSTVTMAGSSTLAATGRQTVPSSITMAGTNLLIASADEVIRFVGTSSVTVSGSVQVRASIIIAGSSTLVSGTDSFHVYGTDTSNTFNGLSLGGRALTFVTQAVATPPFALGPQRFEKAIAFPQPTVDAKGRATFENNVVAKLASKGRVLMNGQDITWFAATDPGDTPIEVPGYELTEPFAYGASDQLVIKRTNSLFERYGQGRLSFLFDGARVEYQHVNDDGTVTDYRGIVMAVRPSKREWIAEISGEVSGRAELIKMPQPLIWKVADIGAIVRSAVKGLGLHFYPNTGPVTGLRAPAPGNVSLAAGLLKMGAASRTADTQARALMPKAGEWGGQTWAFVEKDTTTVHGTAYPDGIRVDLSGLVDDLTEQPNTVLGNGVTPDGLHWKNSKYPGYFQGDPAPYPFGDTSHTFGLNTTNADTDTGDGISVMTTKLAQMDYLSDEFTGLGTFTADVVRAVNWLKDDAGLTQNGIMTSATWAALWNTDVVGYSPDGARQFPLAQDPKVRGFNYSSTGSVIGHNPAFVPGTIRVDIEIDYGIAEKDAAIRNARDLIRLASGHQWAGDFSLNDIAIFAGDHDASDALTLTPDDILSQLDIRPGMNIKLVYFDGSSVLLHIAAVKVGAMDIYGARTVTLTGDTGGRDAFDLGEALDRNRESNRSPSREWLIQNRPNRPVRNAIERDEWFGKHPDPVVLRGGHWNEIPVIMGQQGMVNQTLLELTVATTFCYAVFVKQMHEGWLDHYVGDPAILDGDGRTVFEQDNLQAAFEAGLLLTVQGAGIQKCGFGWRHGYYANGDRILSNPLTGTHLDKQSWAYETLRGKLPVVWLAIRPEDDCSIKRGRWFSALGDDLT